MSVETDGEEQCGGHRLSIVIHSMHSNLIKIIDKWSSIETGDEEERDSATSFTSFELVKSVI